MIRQHFGEVAVDLQPFVFTAGARQITPVGLHCAQRLRVGLVSAGEALAGAFFVVGEIENESGMQILENTVPIRSGQLVQSLDRATAIAGTGLRPGRQQRRRQIGDRTADRLRHVLARRGVAFLLEIAHADYKT